MTTKSFSSHPFTIASVLPCSFLSVFFFFFFLCFFFIYYIHYLTLIINICHCLNYTLLLLHLITTHLVSHLSLSSIIFIVTMLIISIFYCLNYIKTITSSHFNTPCNRFYNYVIKICPRQLLWFIQVSLISY